MKSRSFSTSVQVMATCLLAAVALPSQAAGYSLQTVNLPGAFVTTLFDVNNSGTAVGVATLDMNVGVSTGVVFANGTLSTFSGPPGAVSTDLAAITNAGTLFGNYATTLIDDGSGYLYAGPTTIFSYDAGIFRTYAVPGITDPYARAVSPNGRWIVGTYADIQQNTQSYIFDTLTNTSTLLQRAGVTNVIVAGANDVGQVVGYDRTPVPGVGSIGTAWVYDIGAGTFADVAIPVGAVRNAAQDINASGVISGYFGDGHLRNLHGFAGLGDNEFELIDVQGALGTAVLGANDQGTLVGYYETVLDGSSGAFIARAVPEPGTALLLLLGVAGLGARRWAAQHTRH